MNKDTLVLCFLFFSTAQKSIKKSHTHTRKKKQQTNKNKKTTTTNKPKKKKKKKQQQQRHINACLTYITQMHHLIFQKDVCVWGWRGGGGARGDGGGGRGEKNAEASLFSSSPVVI